MIQKYVLLCTLILFGKGLLASNDPETKSASLKAGSFCYEKEIFSLHITSDVDQDNPSLAKLYQDALTRKTHLDALLQHVQESKLNPIKNKKLIEHTNYRHTILKQNNFEDRPQDLRAINLLSSEYMVERDLVDYFLQALGHFIQTQPTKKQFQELYQQVVYTCRRNLSSLQAHVFHALAYTYPKFYWLGSDNNSQYKDANFKDYLNHEDQVYANFLNQFPNGANTDDLDTVAITKIARYGIRPHVTFTNPDIITELNSLFFYLNIERALLNACPDLIFKPEEYKFEKNVTSQNNKFVFSRISAHHRQGPFYALMQNSHTDKKKLATYLRMKDRLLETTCKNPAQEPIDFFLTKLFPEIRRVEGPAKTGSTSTQNTQPINGKKNKKKPNKILNIEPQNQEDKKGLPIHLANLLIQEELPQEDHFQDTSQALQEIETLIASQDTQKPTYAFIASSPAAQPTPLFEIAPYKSKMHIDHYTYKRCISTTENGSYSFCGMIFDMPHIFFDVRTLREIKKLTNHYPKDSHLQNLASYRLRFHFRHENGSLDMMDFVSSDQYLSGGRSLNADYRHQHHIKTALHDYLTPVQAQAYLKDKKSTKRDSLLNVLSNQLNECAVQGPWHYNCADSEALMVIDLQEKIPTMLQTLASQPGEKITLLGAVLGVSSYHHLCWRCRNLVQGWQWGLGDTITHWKNSYQLPVTLSGDFSTIVFGFGEVSPQSHEFYPPRPTKKATVLGTSDIDAKRHKLKIVSVKKNIF